MAGKNALGRYREKRDFSRTPEPRGAAARGLGWRYLIQKHAATRLHYDFRLQLGGTLKSWAVTRGPSLDPAEKRLAVEVEDHPVEYGTFEGTIPKGQYGGGTVMLWDTGTWEPIGDPARGLAEGKLEFLLHGERLQGRWTLVRMRGRAKDRGRRNWLLIKHADAHARPNDADRLLVKHATSVASGRTLERIAAADGEVWHSDRKAAKPKLEQPVPAKKRAGRPHTPMPPFRTPQLATLVDALPRGNNWVHEIKLDGYRAIAYVQSRKVRIFTRSGQDWTHKFQNLATLLEALPARSAVLDGEITALDERGHSSFKTLQNALSQGNQEQLQYCLFDLLYLDGRDLTALPLLQRKELLQPLLREPAFAGRILYSEHIAAGGEDLFVQACRLHLEGLISKRADAAYTHGRSKSWLKVKCHRRQEFVIGGFTPPKHAQRGIGALLVGYYEGRKLIYAGKVGTGFNAEDAQALRQKLDPLQQERAPFAAVPAAARRSATWVRPERMCEVAFTEWTADGMLRHPSYQGLRADKPATAVHRDVVAKPPATLIDRHNERGASVGGIRISHPERVIYPAHGATKLQLAEYYLEVAERILPHIRQRPLSVVRCPEGVGHECFFQRHIAAGQLAHVYDIGIPVSGRTENYVTIRDVRGLLSLVQWGVIELHPWGCRADRPELPDRMVFDLDPDPQLPWHYVLEGAREIRERMREFGLESYVKTTGGKGLHVVIPMQRSHGWDAIKAFTHAVADSMQRDNPRRYVAKANKEARQGKIFVDFLRNARTATAIAPFSVRARDLPTLAMPLAWEQLKPSLRPQNFNLDTVTAYLRKRKNDPWADFFTIQQKLASAHLRALRITN